MSSLSMQIMPSLSMQIMPSLSMQIMPLTVPIVSRDYLRSWTTIPPWCEICVFTRVKALSLVIQLVSSTLLIVFYTYRRCFKLMEMSCLISYPDLADAPAMLYKEAIVYISYHITHPNTRVTTTVWSLEEESVEESVLAFRSDEESTMSYTALQLWNTTRWFGIELLKVLSFSGRSFVSSMIAFAQSTTEITTAHLA